MRREGPILWRVGWWFREKGVKLFRWVRFGVVVVFFSSRWDGIILAARVAGKQACGITSGELGMDDFQFAQLG